MAKGYWIGRVDVTNPDGYKAYVAANAEPFRKYGARFVVRGGKYETMEGGSRARHVDIEFKDYATARPNISARWRCERAILSPTSS